MNCRGIRGATSVQANDADAIIAATRELLEHIIAANQVEQGDVASVIFTATPDLDAAYPAFAARQMGWIQTPLICHQDLAVNGSLPHCIRVLVLWNTSLRPEQIEHIYLRDARSLRPDLTLVS